MRYAISGDTKIENTFKFDVVIVEQDLPGFTPHSISMRVCVAL